MKIEKRARPTLTAVELDPEDEFLFTLVNGETRRLRVLESGAGVWTSNLETAGGPGPHAKVELRMHCKLEVDGVAVSLNRWVGNQDSFYEPWDIFGMRIWFDGCQALFEHLTEDHGPCKPGRAVRLAIQDATLRDCPLLLHPWCPLPEGGLRIARDCYQGSDCWMGPYYGVEAHGGLDINHPAGTPIWTPLAVDEQELFNRVADGDNNNRWRGIKRWPDGAVWILQVHHILRMRVPEHVPVEAGAHLADGAGVWVGSHEHSHFAFTVVEPGEEMAACIRLDPWILFRQMYLDRGLGS